MQTTYRSRIDVRVRTDHLTKRWVLHPEREVSSWVTCEGESKRERERERERER
eukprot:COSAG03_NODE_21545_length_302_cov_249.408867_2_plen_52_part_01